MKIIQFDGIFTEEGWVTPGWLEVAAEGKIIALHKAKPANVTEVQRGYLLPGFPNSHSHAFQYAMAGLAEYLPPQAEADDFWSWREAMYRLALEISPEAVGAVAQQLYSDMLGQGITGVAEFHYLHHDRDGKRYNHAVAMGEQLAIAAKEAGMHLTLVPVYYRNGSFDQPAKPTQRRFLFENTADFFRFRDDIRAMLKRIDGGFVGGFGVHSLRAGSQEDCREIMANTEQPGPIHIHIAEQLKEVSDCEKAWGKRPVRWLVENVELSSRHSLVHATHMTQEETKAVAASKATVVICPSTEGNLGDGFFDLKTYRQHQGHWAIGTDSHVGINPWEELRWLDYGQRLQQKKRNTLCQKAGTGSGDLAFRESWRGGRQSLGLGLKMFGRGDDADAVLLNPDHPAIAAKPLQHLVSCLVYAGREGLIKGVLRRGEWVVWEGRHQKATTILPNYMRVMKQLLT